MNKENIVVIAIIELRVAQQHASKIRKKVEFTAVYGLHTIAARKPLWQTLVTMEATIVNPWLIMGDFNAVLNEEDRIGGSQVQDAETQDFANMIDNTGLTMMKATGRFYTWTNSHVHSRIDRALVNSAWMNRWPQVEVEVKDPQFSDHALLCVKIGTSPQRGAKPFRFLNHLCKHKDFLRIVRESWEKPVYGKGMVEVWNKLKNMKEAMKHLNTAEFSRVENRIQETRQQLQVLQEKLKLILHDPVLFEQERVLKHELEKWVLVEESILKQKSRVQWLQLGDTNSAYFHASIKSRLAQNHINILVTTNGEVLTKEKEIEEDAVSFYKGLLGTCAAQLPAIDPRVMNSGKILHRD
ncbi:uncharacterized protein LOC132600312 [Lycium barbarum]|uniref:uncharacterized protein LOC132600312 n=1 Tax=Lycium barbarum TaxID=112863 RepID=UPI00293E1F04|nr:uncharacterized protein LOC132600312 [Lycium barbarum]